METLKRIVILGALPILMFAASGANGAFRDDQPGVGRRLDAINRRVLAAV